MTEKPAHLQVVVTLKQVMWMLLFCSSIPYLYYVLCIYVFGILHPGGTMNTKMEGQGAPNLENMPKPPPCVSVN